MAERRSESSSRSMTSFCVDQHSFPTTTPHPARLCFFVFLPRLSSVYKDLLRQTKQNFHKRARELTFWKKVVTRRVHFGLQPLAYINTSLLALHLVCLPSALHSNVTRTADVIAIQYSIGHYNPFVYLLYPLLVYLSFSL